MASAANFASRNPSDQLFTPIVLDAGQRTDISNLTNGLRNVHGGGSYFYALLGTTIGSSDYFGLVTSYTDTTAANYRFNAIRAEKTTIG